MQESMDPTMDNLSAVCFGGPENYRVKLIKRPNVVDIDWVPHWAPGQGSSASQDPSGRLRTTSKIFDELQVRPRLYVAYPRF